MAVTVEEGLIDPDTGRRMEIVSERIRSSANLLRAASNALSSHYPATDGGLFPICNWLLTIPRKLLFY